MFVRDPDEFKSWLQILDEKSLIKKYQREISSLKQELEQLKRGILEGPYHPSGHEDLVTLRQQVRCVGLLLAALPCLELHLHAVKLTTGS